ncbi:hypothetical protein AADZ90_016110 [Aestuariibius sp. 2305UL40-4]|uniref:hypothetical protein n=1 Tax=Aestuariibius violaceus TaxID=3234132 RepID=UPI00345F01A0
MPAQKIATCCYCGTRAALVLSGDKRHELACSSCGAPLHEMKMLPSKAAKKDRRPADPYHDRRQPVRDDYRYRKRKKRKSLKRKILSEAFDLIEDIFD